MTEPTPRFDDRVVAVAIVAVVLIAIVVITRLGQDDGDDASGPTTTTTTVPPREAVDEEGPAQLRWSTESNGDAIADLELLVDGDRVARIDESAQEYQVGDQTALCFQADGQLMCELLPAPRQLLPISPVEIGQAAFLDDDGAEERTFVGREATCSTVTAESNTTEICIDDVTGIIVLLDTTSAEGDTFRQELVAWDSIDSTDIAFPSEAEALLG
ncbi:MAG: hypothetical protein AAF548_09985 [Actinomycetota bacterium]